MNKDQRPWDPKFYNIMKKRGEITNFQSEFSTEFVDI